MGTIWIVIGLILAGFIGGRLVFAKEALPNILRDIFLTGWEYVLIGVALGPFGFALVSHHELELLDPFLSLGLGWAGLIFGLQMRSEDLAKVSRGLLRFTIVQAAAVFAALWLVATLFVLMIFTLSFSETFTAGCAIAAAGALSSPTPLAILAQQLPRTALPGLHKLLVIANLDLAPVLVVVGITFCFFPPAGGGVFDFMRGIELAGYAALLAFAMAGLFRFFGREALTPEEDLAVIIGFLAFISGVALYLGLSPLFLSLIVGVTLANSLKSDDPIFAVLYSTEKPFYVILLLITGLWWGGLSAAGWGMAAALFLIRLWLKERVVSLLSPFFVPNDPLPARGGFALSSQGALAFAIGINYLVTYPGEAPRLVFGVIVATTIASEIAAPFLIRRLFAREERPS